MRTLLRLRCLNGVATPNIDIHKAIINHFLAWKHNHIVTSPTLVRRRQHRRYTAVSEKNINWEGRGLVVKKNIKKPPPPPPTQRLSLLPLAYYCCCCCYHRCWCWSSPAASACRSWAAGRPSSWSSRGWSGARCCTFAPHRWVRWIVPAPRE